MSDLPVDIDTLADKAYLGDGLYCGLDTAGYIWVWAHNGLRLTYGPVAFEPATMTALSNYCTKHWGEPS
jgi:hypothetical protein